MLKQKYALLSIELLGEKKSFLEHFLGTGVSWINKLFFK